MPVRSDPCEPLGIKGRPSQRLTGSERSPVFQYGAAETAEKGGIGSGYESDDSVADRMTEKHVSWQGAAWVINASVIGMGVLTMPRCFAVLGWGLGLAGLIICFVANMFIASLMMEIQLEHPRAISLADAAQIAANGSRTAKTIVRVVLYSEKAACFCAFIHLMARTLGSVFYDVHWCEGVWCVLIVFIFLPCTKLKNVNETFWLNLLNFATIVVTVLMTCIFVMSHGRRGIGLHSDASRRTMITTKAELWNTPVSTSWAPMTDSFTEIFGALSMMVFAFSGNWMYFELMAEMVQPHSFLKSFSIAGPTQIGLYLLMGAVGFGVLGANVPASLVEALEFGPVMRVTSLFLLVHIICGTATNMVVLTRFFHFLISPKDINDDTWRAQSIRVTIYLLIFGGGTLVTLSMQSFGSLVMLVGAFFEAPISFVVPVIIYARVFPSSKVERRGWQHWCKHLFGAAIAVVGMLIMVFGVVDAVHNLGNAKNPPFSCNCGDMWNTCECSAARMPVDQCAFSASRAFGPLV